MVVKVVSKEDPTIEETLYPDAVQIKDCFTELGYCYRIYMVDGSTATYPANEWKIYELKFVSIN